MCSTRGCKRLMQPSLQKLEPAEELEGEREAPGNLAVPIDEEEEFGFAEQMRVKAQAQRARHGHKTIADVCSTNIKA